MNKIQPSCFFEAREELYTGEETPLDLLLNCNSLNKDIYDHINGFLGEKIEVPCFNDNHSYLICYDDVNNKYTYPIDEEERHCFEYEWCDDFVIDVQQ